MKAIAIVVTTAAIWAGRSALPAARACVGQDAFHVVAPGSPELRPSHLGTGRWHTAFGRVVDGKEVMNAGYLWDVRRIKEGGKDVILSLQFSTSANGGYDSTFMDSRTLAPVAFRSRNPGDTTIVSFHGAHYTAKQKNVKSGEKSAEGSLPQSAFDGTALDIVIGALPLADGYSAKLPMFMPNRPDSISNIAWETVRVIGSTETQGRAAWKVEINSPHGIQTALVDKENGAMLDRRLTVPNMGELHMVREPVKD